MTILNIDKIPKTARRILVPFVEELCGIYGNDIVSVFAYGSVTGPDYNPKTSDMNIAVVLNDVSLSRLKPSLKTVRKGLRLKVTAPLFLTPSYIKMSLDTFPMEFAEMKDSRCVLVGEDVLADIGIVKEDLRRECEYQLKGKLLTIRQAYLEQALKHKALERLIKASFRALMPVFRSLLRLKSDNKPPVDKQEVLCQVSEKYGIDAAAFLEVLSDKKNDGRIAGKTAEEFLNDFLVQLERLIEAVDRC